MATTQDNSARSGRDGSTPRVGGSTAGSRAGRSALLGTVLVGLGAFLVVAGLLAQVYLPGRLERAPIDVDEVTNLEGVALLPANFSDPGNLEQAPVKIFKRTVSDGDKSNGDVAVYDAATCLVRDEDGIEGCVSSDDPEGRLVTISTDRFAVDRKDAEAVNDSKYVGDDAVAHEGLVNKFPFDVEKKTYQIWDLTAAQPVDVVYDATQKINGLEVYTFKSSITDDDAEVLPDIQGRYVDESTFFVAPETGRIVDKQEHQERYIGADALVLELDIAFTDAERSEKINEEKDAVSGLQLLTLTLPIIAYILGAILLGLGIFLTLRSRRSVA